MGLGLMAIRLLTLVAVTVLGCSSNSHNPPRGGDPKQVTTKPGQQRVADKQDEPKARKKAKQPRRITQRSGTTWTPAPTDPFRLPTLTEIRLPSFPGSYAIWGATGRDDSGLVWFGVSATGVPNPSARLYSFNPQTEQVTLRGDVVSQLKSNGVYRDGEGQMKIHSKIVQGDDGWIYFASMDEQGEKSDGVTYPKWGGHLWRLHPSRKKWEHLLSTKEALIALDGNGRWIYALGYFQHVLYQFDTQTRRIRQIKVGSAGAHISRNFLVDLNGHAYVPRVSAAPSASKNKGKVELRASLVEFDQKLQPVGETSLPHYGQGTSFSSHGLTSFANLSNGVILFTTHLGRFYRVEPGKKASAKVTEIGWFHPRRKSYTSVLSAFTGGRYACGIARLKGHNYQWVVYDLQAGRSLAIDFPKVNNNVFTRRSFLLYGSNTRDESGRSYPGGRFVNERGSQPVLLQLTP